MVVERTTRRLRITPAQYPNLKSLFESSPLAIGHSGPQRTRRSGSVRSTTSSAASGAHILAVNDIRWAAGAGLDFIIGLTFPERFHSVFDTGRRRIGLATTQFTT